MCDQPLFESLEGIRGTGKTTLAPLLAAARSAILVPTVPPCYQPLRQEIDRCSNVEARLCFYLSALFMATDEIQRHLSAGTPVVVESYFARCLASHEALGARTTVMLPPGLPHPTVYQLVCGEQERKRRLATARQAWLPLGRSRGAPRDPNRQRIRPFPALKVDTTGLTPDKPSGRSWPSPRKEPAEMRTSSLWELTLSFFPQFLAALKEHTSPGASVAVVGASDGKFVMPLAAAGYRVIAIECDPLALHGGEVRLPGDTTTQAMGLIARLKAEDLHDQVQIVERDFLADGPAAARATPSGRAVPGTTA